MKLIHLSELTMNAILLSESVTLQQHSFCTVSPLKLARLDAGVFSSLCALGTSSERICQLLSLEIYEYEEIRLLLSL